MGREILQQPKLLVVAQPTWGVDVGAAAFIRQALIDLRTAGTAILVISEELDELFEICDRIAVIANGRLSPTKRTADTSVEEIGVWMSGMWPGAERGRRGAPCCLDSKRAPSPRTRCAMRRRCSRSCSRFVGGLVIFAALGKNPVEGLPRLLSEPAEGRLRRVRAPAEGDAADADRRRPRRRLPRQRLEHRRRGPVHRRRDRRRRRRALLRRQLQPAAAAADGRGRRHRRGALGVHRGACSRPSSTPTRSSCR